MRHNYQYFKLRNVMCYQRMFYSSQQVHKYYSQNKMAEYMGHTLSSVYTVGERTLSDAGNRLTRAAGSPPNGFYSSSTSANQLSNQRVVII